MKAFANGVWEHRIKQIARFGYHRSIIAYSLLTVCDGEGWIRVHSPTVQNPASATSRALLKRPQAKCILRTDLVAPIVQRSGAAVQVHSPERQD
jgi:hypothetical protein